MKDTRHKRQPAEIETDLIVIAQWLTEGKTHQEIAELLAGIRPYRLSRQQINADVRKLEARWMAEAMENIDKLKAKQLRDLRAENRQLWAQWEASKRHSYGDPKFMRLILEVGDRIADLFGLYAPTKTILTGADGGPLQIVQSLTTKTDEELEKLIKVAEEDDAKHAESSMAGEDDRAPENGRIAIGKTEINTGKINI